MSTILMIGNDAAFVRDARLSLQQQGHQVILVADGATGLVTAALRRPDLVILDGQDCALSLSETSGTGCEALVRCLKNDVRTAHTPILALRAKKTNKASTTGAEAEEDAQDQDIQDAQDLTWAAGAWRLGVDTWLSQSPLSLGSLDELTAAVQNALRPGSNAGTGTNSNGTLAAAV